MNSDHVNQIDCSLFKGDIFEYQKAIISYRKALEIIDLNNRIVV